MTTDVRPPAYLIASSLGEVFAISTSVVSEVIPMPQLSRLPGAPRDVLGVGWVRNAVRVVRTVVDGEGASAPKLLLITTDDLSCVAVDDVRDLSRSEDGLRRVEAADLRTRSDGEPG